jgi:hypothetical protein
MTLFVPSAKKKCMLSEFFLRGTIAQLEIQECIATRPLPFAHSLNMRRVDLIVTFQTIATIFNTLTLGGHILER